MFGSELDEDPRIIAFLSRPHGRMCLLLLVGFLLKSLSVAWIPVTLGAAACAWAGKRRFTVLTFATLGLLIWDPFWFDAKLPELAVAQEHLQGLVDLWQLRWATILAFFLFATALLQSVQRFPQWVVARRPILSLLLFYTTLVALATSGWLRGLPRVFLWSFVNATGGYLWFLCYALLDQRSKQRSPLVDQYGTFHPFWGSSLVPVGKGMANLRKVEATSVQELAITQAKGVKLLLGCWILQHLLDFSPAYHSYCQIPTWEKCYESFAAGAPYPVDRCWLSLVGDFFESVMALAVWGNTVVACARVAGFRLLRNTYKPLQSRSIAEFWNRFFYYFKELLVEFFFYPTFIRCFKKNKKLRIAFATFMAVGFGNAFFHFVKNIGYLVVLGWSQSLWGFRTYAFYCCALSAGLIISQLQTARVQSAGWAFRITAFLRISGFYCFLHVFDEEFTYSPISQHFGFIFHLFGLR